MDYDHPYGEGERMRKALKRLCKNCGKRREEKFFLTSRSRRCEICKVAGKNNNTVIQSLPDLRKSIQKLFNAYIRQRDKDLSCISCGSFNARAWHAGHYWAQGMNGVLRFHEDNVWKQCDGCNVWKHGNLLNYRINLVKRIGEERVKYLDDHHRDVKKWSREELLDLQDKLKALLKS